MCIETTHDDPVVHIKQGFNVGRCDVRISTAMGMLFDGCQELGGVRQCNGRVWDGFVYQNSNSSSISIQSDDAIV